MKAVILVVGLVAMFAFGVVSVVWSRRVQEFSRRELERSHAVPRLLLSGWINSPAYLVVVRLVGAMAIAATAFVVYAWLFLRVSDSP